MTTIATTASGLATSHLPQKLAIRCLSGRRGVLVTMDMSEVSRARRIMRPRRRSRNV